MGTLYILRHGNTFDKGDVVRRVGCRTDLPLSVSGTEQAARVAEAFAAQGVGFARIVSSPLQRTRQTAEAVARAQGFGGVIEPLPFLVEVDYGPDENQPEEAVVARVGEEALRLWDTQGVVPAGWQLDVAAVTAGWQALLDGVAVTDGNVLAVTSNGIARFALPLVDCGDVPVESLKLGTCRYGVVECTAQGARLREWNVKVG